MRKLLLSLLSIILFFILSNICYSQMPINPYYQLNNTRITEYPNRYHFGFPMPYYNFMKPLYKPFDYRNSYNPYSPYNNYAPLPRLHYYTGGYGLYYHWSW